VDSKKVLPILGGVVAGAVALLIYQKYAAAATPAATPALPSAAPASAQVNLQPGQTTISVSKSGNVILALPSGASWSTSTTPIVPLAASGVQPTGTMNFNVQMSGAAGVYPLTANWVDSTGTAQSTTINIAAS